jgi:hypothetical protein
VTQHHEGLKPESDLAILRWQRLMEQALTGLNSQVMPATHDEALGLLAYVEPAFERIELSAGWRYTTKNSPLHVSRFVAHTI